MILVEIAYCLLIICFFLVLIAKVWTRQNMITLNELKKKNTR